MQYKIYYADGSTFSGPPADAPGFGVIAILQQNGPQTFHIIFGHPYYLMVDGSWLPAKENDIIDSLVHRLGEMRGFCVGQVVSDEKFREIFSHAKRDRDAEALD